MAYTIWSSIFDLDDFDLDEICDENGLDCDNIEAITDCVADYNLSYLDCAVDDCNIDIPEGLVVFGTAGRWNGDASGIVRANEQNIGNCFNLDADYWQDKIIEINDDNDLVIHGYHHDGIDTYTIRKWKSAELRDEMIDKLDTGELLPKDVYHNTEPIGSYIKEIYGWD